MELVKLVPQAFFDFFARLVPGLLALVLWILLFDQNGWGFLLKAVTAEKLDEDNVIAAIMVVGTAMSYVLGQLIAPFGKLFQRVAELAAIALGPKESDENRRDRLKKKMLKILGHCDEKIELSDYDWLRAKFPPSGELVAKIRGEATMFYSMSAVTGSALIGICLVGTFSGLKVWTLAILSIACLLRGHSTMNTHKETAQKLREGHTSRGKRPASAT